MNNLQHHDYAVAGLRVALGVMFLAHGLYKLLVFTPEGVANFFASIGLPAFLGPLTMSAEILGGIGLILGFYCRWVLAALIPVLVGAILFVHGGNGWPFSSEGGGWEYPAFLLVAASVQWLFGDGVISVRHLLNKGTGYSTAAS